MPNILNGERAHPLVTKSPLEADENFIIKNNMVHNYFDAIESFEEKHELDPETSPRAIEFLHQEIPIDMQNLRERLSSSTWHNQCQVTGTLWQKNQGCGICCGLQQISHLGGCINDSKDFWSSSCPFSLHGKHLPSLPLKEFRASSNTRLYSI